MKMKLSENCNRGFKFAKHIVDLVFSAVCAHLHDQSIGTYNRWTDKEKGPLDNTNLYVRRERWDRELKLQFHENT